MLALALAPFPIPIEVRGRGAPRSSFIAIRGAPGVLLTAVGKGEHTPLAIFCLLLTSYDEKRKYEKDMTELGPYSLQSSLSLGLKTVLQIEIILLCRK